RSSIMGHTAYLDENEDPGNPQFKGINYMKNLKAKLADHFTRSFANQLSGFEVTNIVESYIRSNSEKRCDGSPRSSAVRVSFLMLQEGFIRPIVGGETTFNEDRRTFYRLGNPDEVQSVVILPRGMKSRESSCEREKPQRRSSFSRILQSPLLRRGSVSRTSSKFSLSSSSSSDKSTDQDELIDDETRLFEFALARLLTLVDIPQIEELVDMQSHCGDEVGSTANLLTSILSKMGLWGEEEGGADPSTIVLLKKHRRAEMVHSYFKAVRFMCPRLQIQEDRSMDEYDQVEQWGRQALKAVSNRLDSITRNGYSPLIPREFSKVVSSIALLSKQKLSEAVVYLCGMIPYKLRKELFLVLDFLSQCESTNLIFRLCDSRHCKMNSSLEMGENLSHAIDSLRTFIVPQIGMDLEQQRYVISVLVENRIDLQQKVTEMREEALSRCSPVPARFCEAVEEDSATDRQLAELIVLILKDERVSQPDKFKKLQLMQTQHPKAYAIYMKNLL
ncbi:toe-2, partial [Pristionchus pacificus]